MACPMRRMKGSGYVKESSGGNNELSNRLSDLMAQREQQINAIFSNEPVTPQLQIAKPVPAPPPAPAPITPSSRKMELAVYSLALDKYVTERVQRALTQPETDSIYIETSLYLDVRGAENIRYFRPPRKQPGYVEIAQFTTPRWGACMLHIFL